MKNQKYNNINKITLGIKIQGLPHIQASNLKSEIGQRKGVGKNSKE